MDDVISGNDNEPATKGDLRTLAATLREDLRNDMREMLRPITLTLAHHTAELADIRGHIKDKMVTREEFHSRMDGFTGKVQDFEYSSAKNREVLQDLREIDPLAKP